jgi:hypothetical protein
MELMRVEVCSKYYVRLLSTPRPALMMPSMIQVVGCLVEDMPCTWIDHKDSGIYWRDKENFTFDEERDLPIADLVMDESRGSICHEGLNPDNTSIENVLVENVERGSGYH